MMTREEAKSKLYDVLLEKLGTTKESLGRNEGSSLNSVVLVLLQQHYPTMDYVAVSRMFETSPSNAHSMRRRGLSLIEADPWRDLANLAEAKVFGNNDQQTEE